MVFWELRRFFTEIYYFNENNKECDLVVFEKNKPKILIQVCANLHTPNMERESSGLIDAMNFFDIDKGYIITLNQKDLILSDDKRIEVVPFYEMNLENL